MRKRRVGSLILATTIALTPAVSLAHKGRTDSNGGHRDNKNVSGLGSYHYHHGYGAHLHTNGCPYGNKTKANTTTSKKSTSSKKILSSSKSAANKQVQARLNKLGYNCGAVDGGMGPKTLSAIKSFQKSKGLKVDGLVGPATRRALGI